MSIAALNAAFALQGIGPTEGFVLVALANFADEAWECFPSKATLAKMTKLSPRTITLALKRLEDAGYLMRIEQHRANGSSTSNRYTLHLGEGGEFDAPSPLNAPPPRRHVPPGGEPRAPPEPPTKPPKEPKAAKASLPAKADQQSPARIAFDAYNAMAEEFGWPKAVALNDTRRGHLNARIKDAGGLDAFLAYMRDIENSPFLMGRKAGQFGAFAISLEFILQPSSFLKLMEGFYHRERQHDRSDQPSGRSAAGTANDSRNAAMLAGLRTAVDRS